MVLPAVTGVSSSELTDSTGPLNHANKGSSPGEIWPPVPTACPAMATAAHPAAAENWTCPTPPSGSLNDCQEMTVPLHYTKVHNFRGALSISNNLFFFPHSHSFCPPIELYATPEWSCCNGLGPKSPWTVAIYSKTAVRQLNYILAQSGIRPKALVHTVRLRYNMHHIY